MSLAAYRIANKARRDAGEAGLAAITYIKAIKTKGEDGNIDWRVESAYKLARLAASRALEYESFMAGNTFYPAASRSGR